MDEGKMVVTKVLICGGLVVVVAYGLYACSCRLRHRRARSLVEGSGVSNPAGGQVHCLPIEFVRVGTIFRFPFELFSCIGFFDVVRLAIGWLDDVGGGILGRIGN